MPKDHDEKPKKELWEIELEKLHIIGDESPKAPIAKSKPTPAQADRIADSAHHEPHAGAPKPEPTLPSWKTRLAYPPQIDLGELKTDRDNLRTIFIPFLGRIQGPKAESRVTGDPAIQLSSSPNFLPASAEPYNPSYDFKLKVRPTQEGPVSGQLAIHVFDAPAETIEIPIIGTATSGPDEPEVPKGPPEFTPLPQSIDLGEQIVGSEHWFTIGTTKLSRYYPLMGRVTSSVKPPADIPNIPDELRMDMGTNAFLAGANPQRIGKEWPPKGAPIAVFFRPKRSGRFRGDVAVAIHWSDGRVDHQQVAVTAGARTLEDAPEQTTDPAQPEQLARTKQDPVITGKAPDPNDMLRFSLVTGWAEDKATTLATQQELGLKKAQEEILGYVKATEKPSWFAMLADLAITMAIGGIAQVLSKFLARNLVSMIAQNHPDAVKSSHLVDGLAAGFKDGLKSTARRAIDKNPTAGMTGGAGSESANPTVDFFARQRSILANLADQNRDLVRNEQQRLSPALATQPRVVLSIFETLRDSFEQTSTIAQDEQARATVGRWVSGLAQASRGQSTARRAGENFGQTTKLDEPSASRDAPGLLELYVTLDGVHVDLERLHVDKAELHGVAGAAAQRLQSQDLGKLGIPIRIVVRSSTGTAIITRDEAGRVHVEGVLPDQDAYRGQALVGISASRNTDIQLNRDAGAICDRLLSKSLDRWKRTIVGDDRPTGLVGA